MKPHTEKIDSVKVALWLFLVLGLVTAFAPWLVPYDANEIVLSRRLLSPSWEHWLGTDDLGRDTFSRLLIGGRISLSVGVAAAGLSSVIGILLGALSGYFGKWVDMIIMRTVDVIICIPSLDQATLLT